MPDNRKKHANVRAGFISRKENEEETETSMSDDSFTAEENYKLFDEREVGDVAIHVIKLVEKAKKLDCLSKLSLKHCTEHINKSK